jgi:hypothetical protein
MVVFKASARPITLKTAYMPVIPASGRKGRKIKPIKQPQQTLRLNSHILSKAGKRSKIKTKRIFAIHAGHLYIFSFAQNNISDSH